MKTLKITAKDVKKSDGYWSDYIGEDISDYDGHVEIDGSLGWVQFKSISVKGHLTAGAGSGIKAGEGIKAGWGIKAGEGIEAGLGIEAGWGIKAGEGIEAGLGIEAGWGIEAGSGIKAGWGIVSFYSYIKAKLSITCSTTISAGIFSTSGEKEIEAEAIEGGKVIYGKVKLIPKEEKSLVGTEVEVKVEGKTYKAKIVE